LPLASRWILSRLQDVTRSVNTALDEFRFHQAAHELYHFLWDEFCDWFIEASKVDLARPEEAPRARAVLLEVLDASLRLLHPIMPFVTEEIWQKLPHEGPSLMLARYPAWDAAKVDAPAEAAMQRLMRLVTAIRTIRATYEVEPRRKIDVTVVAPTAEERAFLTAHQLLITTLARLERFDVVASAPHAKGTINEPVDGLELRLPMAGLFDVQAEKARLQKELQKIDEELAGLAKRLENPQFVERAKPEVVAQSRARMKELEERRHKVESLLRDLQG
jgi:valyl-tRNA synthetase